MEVWQFVNLLCTGVVTGTYVFEMVVVVSALDAAPGDLSAQVHRLLFSHLPNRYMPALGIGGGIAAFLVLLDDAVKGFPQSLYIAGLAAWVATFILLAGFSRPIDLTITRWAETSLPADRYAAKRATWDHLMMIRGSLGIAAYSCFVLAALETA